VRQKVHIPRKDVRGYFFSSPARVQDNGSARIMPQPNKARKGSFASDKPTGYHTGRCTNI